MYDEAVRDYESANEMVPSDQEVTQLLQQAELELMKSKRTVWSWSIHSSFLFNIIVYKTTLLLADNFTH